MMRITWAKIIPLNHDHAESGPGGVDSVGRKALGNAQKYKLTVWCKKHVLLSRRWIDCCEGLDTLSGTRAFMVQKIEVIPVAMESAGEADRGWR